jgi:hypothetical protein
LKRVALKVGLMVEWMAGSKADWKADKWVVQWVELRAGMSVVEKADTLVVR